MRRYRWTSILFIVGGVSAILLYLIKTGVRNFPEELMYPFFPADYIWNELQGEIRGGFFGKLISNVLVFGILAAAQGALTGLILDLYQRSRGASLDHRVKYLRRSAGKPDLAFQRSVLGILARYDPAGLIKLGLEQDAYTAQADMILTRINKLNGAHSLRKFCKREFRSKLGRRAGKFKQYDSLAKEIWAAYGRQQSPERRSGPTGQGL